MRNFWKRKREEGRTGIYTHVRARESSKKGEKNERDVTYAKKLRIRD